MSIDAEAEIRAVLEAFQAGYTRRDLSQVDAFMQLFAPDCEVIGTNGLRPGADEWYTSSEAARELVHGDWEGWGDLALELDHLRVRVRGDAAWVAVPATVTSTLNADEVISEYLASIHAASERPSSSPEESLLDILRGGANTLFEMRRGEKFVWPLRFTAVLARHETGWLFEQMNFSFPTTRFPDVRIFTPGAPGVVTKL